MSRDRVLHLLQLMQERRHDAETHARQLRPWPTARTLDGETFAYCNLARDVDTNMQILPNDFVYLCQPCARFAVVLAAGSSVTEAARDQRMVALGWAPHGSHWKCPVCALKTQTLEA